ncbi:MAG TPA: hypothetical protein VI933_01035 [archaeon]|nr:hypothetical protein [archaeon]
MSHIHCPSCKTSLVEGETVKQKDGAEIIELFCVQCMNRFADVMIPNELFLGAETELN